MIQKEWDMQHLILLPCTKDAQLRRKDGDQEQSSASAVSSGRGDISKYFTANEKVSQHPRRTPTK